MDGRLNLECVLQDGNAQHARPGRSSAGTHAAAAASKRTRNRTSTSTSGHSLWLGHSRVDTLWKFLWRGDAHRQQTEGTGPSSCDGQTTTGSGQGIGDARSVPVRLGERGATAGGSHETISTLGTEDGPSTISSCCRIWREGDGSTAR